MRLSFKAALGALLIFLSLTGSVAAQSGGNRTQNADQKKKTQRPEDLPKEEQKNKEEQKAEAREEADASETVANQEGIETVRVETNLVTVPVIAADRGDRYIPDLKQEEFIVYEDGVKQEISFFETVTAPFHVVLMIDTSASTEDKLGQIQQAAIAFTEQLQKADRVKVISFDDNVRDLSDFTSDRGTLYSAIKTTRPGMGTRLYDAMATGLKALQTIKGRKAIVIFTDGVDSYSNRESYDKNRRMIEEAGIIIYPIRYDTRRDVEQLVRQQGQGQSGQAVDLASILGGGNTPGTTPTTFPGGGGTPTNVPNAPTAPGRSRDGSIVVSIPGLPGGITVPGTSTRRDTRYPPDDPNRRNDPTDPANPSSGSGAKDSIDYQLDSLYSTADAYLSEIALKSGGKLHRADTLGSLPVAFGQIAAELRTQYSLGYSPLKPERDGKYRKIKVTTSRKDTVVRARPGYRAPGGGK